MKYSLERDDKFQTWDLPVGAYFIVADGNRVYGPITSTGSRTMVDRLNNGTTTLPRTLGLGIRSNRKTGLDTLGEDNIGADAIRAKLGNHQHISLDELKVVIIDGMQKRQKPGQKRGYSTSDLRVDGQQTGSDRRFAVETVVETPPHKGCNNGGDCSDCLIKDLKRDEMKALSKIFNAREILRPLIDSVVKNRSDEITPYQVLALYNIDRLDKIRKRAADLSEEYEEKMILDEFDATPNNVHILNNMYRFDKGPRPRHWEKNSLKKRR